jgi:hypothetical protein
MDQDKEENLLTAECILAELGYKTFRTRHDDALLIKSGEFLIMCDCVELAPMSDTVDDMGYLAKLRLDGVFVGTVNRWLD